MTSAHQVAGRGRYWLGNDGRILCPARVPSWRALAAGLIACRHTATRVSIDANFLRRNAFRINVLLSPCLCTANSGQNAAAAARKQGR